MKKIIFGLIICLGLMNIQMPVFADNTKDIAKTQAKARKAEIKAKKAHAKVEARARKAEIKALKKTYKKVTGEVAIMRALELMKNSPAIGAYGKIMGDNPKLKPMKISYKNLGIMNVNYRNYNALSEAKLGGIHIYVNSKHKNAPIEAQSAAIAGVTAHVDKKESVNELVYAKTLEAFLWNYYLKKNPDLKKDNSTLTLRENHLLYLYKQYPRNSREIVNTVRKQRQDIKYIWESTGYTHREYADKMGKIYEAYLAVENLPDEKFMPVLDYNEEPVEIPAITEEDKETQFIQEHIRSDVKAKPVPEDHYIHQVSDDNQERCEICGCPINNEAPENTEE